MPAFHQVHVLQMSCDLSYRFYQHVWNKRQAQCSLVLKLLCGSLLPLPPRPFIISHRCWPTFLQFHPSELLGGCHLVSRIYLHLIFQLGLDCLICLPQLSSSTRVLPASADTLRGRKVPPKLSHLLAGGYQGWL